MLDSVVKQLCTWDVEMSDQCVCSFDHSQLNVCFRIRGPERRMERYCTVGIFVLYRVCLHLSNSILTWLTCATACPYSCPYSLVFVIIAVMTERAADHGRQLDWYCISPVSTAVGCSLCHHQWYFVPPGRFGSHRQRSARLKPCSAAWWGIHAFVWIS